MKKFLIALVALALLPATVEAGGGGGGGTKANAKIKVNNNGNSDLLVILDKTDAQLAAYANIQAFLDAGGKIVEPGNSVTFTGQKAGSHRVSAAFINDPGTAVTAPASVTVSSVSGGTKTVSAIGNFAGGAPNLSHN